MILLSAILLALFVTPDAWDVPIVVAGGALEIVETVVGIRISRRMRAGGRPEYLIGQTGRVVEACRPSGRVRVLGESWVARCDAGAEVEDRVRIVGREGLTLLVEPE